MLGKVVPRISSEPKSSQQTKPVHMKQEQRDLLNLLRLPGIGDREMVALRTNLLPHEVDLAASLGYLHVLGDAKNNEKKQFAMAEVELLVQDSEKLSALRRSIILWHRRKNASRRDGKGYEIPSASTPDRTNTAQPVGSAQSNTEKAIGRKATLNRSSGPGCGVKRSQRTLSTPG
jgi:hypothetical protein